MNLKVPFAEKDLAKKLGARWDAALKVWYVAGEADLSQFAKWSPSPHDGSAPAKDAGPRKAPVGGKVFVGSAYVVQERLCNCLPWEICDKCAATALRTPL